MASQPQLIEISWLSVGRGVLPKNGKCNHCPSGGMPEPVNGNATKYDEHGLGDRVTDQCQSELAKGAGFWSGSGHPYIAMH